MDRARYLDLLETDGRRLLEAARAADLAAPVPSCAGWTVRDAVEHTAEVYEHKMACIAAGGQKVQSWPPDWPADRDPLQWFEDAHTRLLEVLRTTDPAAPSHTWWPDDQTAGFWVRRMAQETAVHRVDVEGAVGQPTPVDDDLAVDGIDEVLELMLAGDWSIDPQPGSTGSVVVTTPGRSWLVTMTPEAVSLDDPAGGGDARVDGAPSDLLLWLWGRAPDTAVAATGDAQAVRRLRARLALATQ